jgi:hypothetical protein
VNRILVSLFVCASIFAAAATPVCAEDIRSASSINPYTLLDQSRDELAAKYPTLVPAELNLLWFRIADINSMRRSGQPTSANSINPYQLVGLTRAQLSAAFPALSKHEMDLLVFRIADINSMRALQ